MSQTCKICNKNDVRLSAHLKVHNMTSKEYYDKYLSTSIIHSCENILCNNETKFHDLKHGYKRFCSIDCSKKYDVSRLQDKFINESIIKHKHKFGYSKVVYIDAKTYVIIDCPVHGEFLQTPNKHLNQGCSKCSGKGKSLEDVLLEFKNKYDDLYDYSKVVYMHPTKPMTIICRKHGDFISSYRKHLNQKTQCPSCTKVNKNSLTTDDIIRQFIQTHDDTYDYSKVVYIHKQKNVIINCKKHGEFLQRPDNHVNGKGCPRCAASGSSMEREIKDFIESFGLEIITNSRKVISPQEIDIFIPSKNVAIEFNGLFWHSEKNKGQKYHINKTNACENNGIQLIHIFEDEWLFSKDIVKSRISNILGFTEHKIFGRKCEMRNVSSNDSTEFLKHNHIQGSILGKIRIGLYFNNELVSLMVFGNLRKSTGLTKKIGSFELLRFCNKIDVSVIGGADKLLKAFIKNYKPLQIISYADRRWSIGKLYQKLGFDFISNSKPNYSYIFYRTRKHRFNYRKDILVSQGYDKDLTEREIMDSRGIERIYDCGSSKWELHIV